MAWSYPHAVLALYHLAIDCADPDGLAEDWHYRNRGL
jgi:hypothetical protein